MKIFFFRIINFLHIIIITIQIFSYIIEYVFKKKFCNFLKIFQNKSFIMIIFKISE